MVLTIILVGGLIPDCILHVSQSVCRQDPQAVLSIIMLTKMQNFNARDRDR